MREDTYAQQVNRRLASAQLILSLGDSHQQLNPMARQAIVESSLLQFYFAVLSYLNELLAYYRRPAIDDPHFTLMSSLFHCQDAAMNTVKASFKDTFDGIHEVNTLQQWSQDQGGILKALSRLPLTLTELAIKETEGKPYNSAVEKSSSVTKLNLIAVSQCEANDCDLSRPLAIKNMINAFQLLIDAQRENQVEY